MSSANNEVKQNFGGIGGGGDESVFMFSTSGTKRACVFFGSFPVGLAADRSSNLTVDILFLAVDNE